MFFLLFNEKYMSDYAKIVHKLYNNILKNKIIRLSHAVCTFPNWPTLSQKNQKEGGGGREEGEGERGRRGREEEVQKEM